ncbi:hypothetical protein CASFOL_027641 [Castilleja foliolosa]|uniref:Uncharacterized protein n=1 Tax=Castilleja foliolosa TaxID=1961234 RepID=A0ABD3CFD6_9LAMI
MRSIAKKGLQQYLGQLQKHPLRTKVLTAGVLSAISDIVAQKLSGIQKLQLKRTFTQSVFAGFPNMDLRTGIETAGDSTQMGVRVEMVGTQFGVGPRGVPMSANISLANDGWICPAPILQVIVEDFRDWTNWLLYRGGIGVKGEESWEAWWDEELCRNRTMNVCCTKDPNFRPNTTLDDDTREQSNILRGERGSKSNWI